MILYNNTDVNITTSESCKTLQYDNVFYDFNVNKHILTYTHTHGTVCMFSYIIVKLTLDFKDYLLTKGKIFKYKGVFVGL